MNNYIVCLEDNSELYKEYVSEMENIQIVTDKSLCNKQIQKGDAFFVPTGLSEMSPLSYQGVELALKLYFNIVSKQYEGCKVVLLGNEERATFFELCRYAKFIHCPNVWYINNSREAVEGFLKEQHESQFNHDKAIRALKEIGIKQPASYKSHHSITNQWSVSRWSNCYGFETVVDEQIRKSLYFNYLKCVYALPEEFQHRDLPCFTKGRILVIDDELSKGWHTFFGKLFQKRAKNEVEYQELGIDFPKIKGRQKIIDASVDKILEFKPDVVLLDLRLHDDDFGDQCEKFTSIQILEKLNSLEEYNRGTQIIGFTASNKVWNYLKWSKAGIDDFILKESPENSKDQNFTLVSLENLEYKLKRALEKASFLKEIYKKFSEMNHKLDDYDPDCRFLDYSKQNLQITFSLLRNFDNKSDGLDFPFMHLFYIIEDYASTSRNNIIVKDGGSYIVDDVEFLTMPQGKYGKKPINNCMLTYNPDKRWYEEKRGTFNSTHVTIDLKMSAIILFKLRNPHLLQIWNTIRDARNDLVHQNKPVSKKVFSDTVSFLSNIIR